MCQLQEDFSDDLQEGKILAVMPLTRLFFDEPFSIGYFRFYPPNFADLKKLRPIPNRNITNLVSNSSIIELEGQALREVATSSTGISIDILKNSPLIAFTIELNWDDFLAGNHEYDVNLLKILSSKADRALDFLRFDYCRFDLPDTLPGLAGSWINSEQFLSTLLYSRLENESYLIAGAAIDTSIIVKGIGLEISSPSNQLSFDSDAGEVAGVAIHGLSLLSDAMIASNETTKYVRIMTLLEFLGSPDNYKNMKDLKGDIICHCAKDKTDYLKLCDRFKELTSIKDNNGNQLGYRTLIVHHGKFIYEIMPNKNDRNMLFKELQHYCGCVLSDMIRKHTMTWQEFCNYRDNLKRELGIK